MSMMSLGNTLEEKREAYALLTEVSKKWGKVWAIIGGGMGLFIGLLLLGGMGNIVGALILAVIMIAALPICYYWYGQILYYGFLVTKIFLKNRNIGAGEVAGAVGTSVLVSYILGGKKSVKKLSIAWIVILIIALTIGIWAGFYYFIKFRKEAKELGLGAN